MIFNVEQQEAIKAMQKFLNSKEDEFVLIGAAGTGKTTIVKEVLKNIPRNSIIGATISHAAKNVLQESCGEYMNCCTVAQLVGMRQSYEGGKETFKVDNFARKRIQEVRYVI